MKFLVTNPPKLATSVHLLSTNCIQKKIARQAGNNGVVHTGEEEADSTSCRRKLSVPKSHAFHYLIHLTAFLIHSGTQRFKPL